MIKDTEKSTKELIALGIIAKIGKQIKQDFPQIADAYREGLVHEEIVGQFGICKRYGLPLSMAKSAVATAIRGFPGNKLINPYVGLIENSEERARIAKEHVANSMTLEQRVELGRRMQKSRSKDSLQKTGRECYEKGVGIHGLSSVEKAQAARLSCISQGRTPWEPAEYRFACLASRLSEYSVAKIATELNEFFHDGEEIRSPDSVTSKLIIFRESLGLPKRKVVPWSDEEKEFVTSKYGPKIKSYDEALKDINDTFHGGQPVRTKPGLNKFITTYRKQLSQKIIKIN